MKILLRFFKKNIVLVVLSAVLSALPYSVPSLYFLSWISFIPFFLALANQENKIKTDILLGFLFGFLYCFATYWWFIELYPMDFAGISRGTAIFIVILAWVGISLLHGCLFILPGVAVHFAKKFLSPAFSGAAFVASFLLAEWITELGPLAFPWIRVSIGQFRAPMLLQVASLTGVYGTDLIILTVNVLLALTLLYKTKKRFIAVCVAAGVFAGNLLFGFVRISEYSRVEQTRPALSVLAVQGNILSGEKWEDAGTQNSLETYSTLTRENAYGTDLVFWPETAVPSVLNASCNRDILKSVRTLSGEIEAPVITGTFWKVEGQSANAAVLVTESEVSDPYVKRHLVPFGETLPGRPFFETLFPFLTKINLFSEDLAVGTESAALHTDKDAVGTLICFESVFPELARESAADAGLFAVLTNDSWYKDSPAVYQHLAHAVLRSIENDRSTVRAANSGVSAIINPRGAIQEELGPLRQGVVTGSVTVTNETTYFFEHGNFTLPVTVWMTLVWAAVLYVIRRFHDTKQRKPLFRGRSRRRHLSKR